MANKRNKDGSQSDVYKQMHDRQLEYFESMDGGNYNENENDLKFYSEEELEAIEQAKRDAARQAYQDAYLEQYNQSRANMNGSQKHSQGQSKQRAQQNSKQVRSSSQRYGNAARKKHQSEQMEFGNKNEYKNSKKKKKLGGAVVGSFFKGLFIIILVLVILLQLLIFRYINMVNSVETGDRLVTNASMDDSHVKNILLIGSDTRDVSESGRTDSMILLSFNSTTKQTTMTSFMRDSYVEIPDYGWAKLNAAYAYGGAELLMDTIEYNFDVEVNYYVFVNFYSFIDIVDAVGGIEIEVSDEEAEGMTDPLAEQNKYLENESGTDYLTEGGDLTLNGNQALAYARLRYVGNADFERTERQRTVILKIIEQAKTLDLLSLDNFIKVCASELTTNMTKAQMYVLVYQLLFYMNYETEELRIPQDDEYTYGTHDGQSTLDLDFDACQQTIKEVIYN